MTDRFFAPGSARRLATLRILVGAYATIYSIARLPYLLDLSALEDERFIGTGFLTVLDGPPPAAFILSVGLVAIGACAATTVGWRHRFTGPIAAIALLATTTYGNSWGQVFHTENLMWLHVLVLAVVPAADALAMDRPRSRMPDVDERYGWPVKLMVALTVVTYVAAGVAKLRIGGWAWIDGDALRNQIAFDNLRKVRLDDIHSPFGAWLLQFGWLWPPAALFTVIVELGAPVAFVRNRLRYAWVAAAWLFHVGIVATMAIVFPYHLAGIAYAAILPTDRILDMVAERWRGRSGAISIEAGAAQ